MRIVTCPKGGRVPEGYCHNSCLNYAGVKPEGEPGALENLGQPFKSDYEAGLQCVRDWGSRT